MSPKNIRINKNLSVKRRSNFLKRRSKIIPEKKRSGLRSGAAHKDMQLQNSMRREFYNIRMSSALKPVKEIGSGVDFIHWFTRKGKKHELRIDLKFSFGALGENDIKVRVSKDAKRLLNNSDWVLALDRNRDMIVFPTAKLAEYVTKCWGTVSKARREEKWAYASYGINLAHFFAQMGVNPITAKMNPYGLEKALQQMRAQQYANEPAELLNEPLVQTRGRPEQKNTFARSFVIPKKKVPIVMYDQRARIRHR